MKTLEIALPDGKVTVRPVSRAALPQLERLMVELQSYWIAEEFSTGDAIARPEVWDLMARVWTMLPLADQPAATLSRDSLERIDWDYEQLEALFFGDISKAWNSEYQVSINDSEDKAPIQNYKGKLVVPRYLDLAWFAVTGQVDINAFQGCAIWELHRVDARKKLISADELRKSSPVKSPSAPSPPEMSPSPPAVTPKPTPSPTSSTASENSDSPSTEP